MWGSPVWSLADIILDPDAADEHGVHWILTEEKGFWGSPASSAETTTRLNAHGVFRTPGWKGERTITLKGRAFAPDFPTLRRAANRLSGLLSEPDTPVALTCYSEIGALTCPVFLDGDILTQPGTVATPSIEWNLQVMAPDPRKYSTEWRTSTGGLPQPGRGGLDFSEPGLDYGSGADQDGLHFGADTGANRLELTNHGTAPSPPIFTLFGPLHHPTLTTAVGDTYSTMRYNGAITAGQHVVIRPADPAVLLGGTASRRERLNPAEFTGFFIPPATGHQPGRLHVGLTHTGPTGAGGYVEATFRDAWF